jgi:hypothetical protein
MRFKSIPKPLTCGPIISYYRNNKVNLIDYYKNNGHVPKKRRLVEVAWLGSGIKEINISDVGEILDNPLTNLLPVNYSYGAVFAEDDGAVVLKHFENEIGQRELQSIKRETIARITPFYQSGRTNSVVQNNGKRVMDNSDEQIVLTKEDVNNMNLDGVA